MTVKEWKRLKYGAVIRRIAPSADFVEGEEYMIGVTIYGIVYPAFPRVPGYNGLTPPGITDHDNWALVRTAAQEMRREEAWRKAGAEEDADEAEEDADEVEEDADEAEEDV